MTVGDPSRDAPYPGLRSFRRSEFAIFFGRTGHVADMLAKLARHGFLCVTGPSGCGKSSLARTGLFNSLEAGFLPGRGSDWIFCDMHPETDPLDRLCDALATAIVLGESGAGAPDPDHEQTEDIGHLATLFQNHIAERSSDLTGALDKVRLIGGRPIMILIDQFEEIFRYAQDDPEAASRFVDVLLRTSAARGDVYVVITIRTDELAKCARYAGLARAINESQFLTPTLDRFQMQEAIEGPAVLHDATIDPRLSAWMLNGLEEQLDKLPLMQHALRILYRKARDRQPTGHVTIALEDFFEAFDIPQGTSIAGAGSHDALRMSLSHRLDTLYRRMPSADRRIARGLFCALTTTESRDRDIRRPVRLGEAQAVLDCGFEDLVRVIEVFREGSEGYLRIVGEHDGIDAGDTVDVSHECVLRLWRSLQEKWLPEEERAAEDIRFLAKRALEREENLRGGPLEKLLGSGLLSGPTLDRYSRWWKTRRPNAAWAARYLDRGAAGAAATGGTFARIERFVADSRRFLTYKRVGLATVALVMVGLVALTVTLQTNKRIASAEAERDRAKAQARQEIAERLASLNPSPRAAAPVAVARDATEVLAQVLAEAVPREPLARATTVRALNFTHELRRLDLGPGAARQVYAADFLPGGTEVAVLARDLTLTIWDTRAQAGAPRTVQLAEVQTDSAARNARAMAVGPDGTVAVGTERGALLLAEGLSGGAAPRLGELYPGRARFGARDTIGKIAFSRDGATLAASSLTGHVHLWQRGPDGAWGAHRILTTRALLSNDPADRARPSDGQEVLSDNGLAAWSVALDADGARGAVGLGDGRVCVFATRTDAAACRSGAHDAPVKALAFSPDATTLVSGGNDDTLRIWSLAPWRPGLEMPQPDLSPAVLWHESDLWDVAYDDTGKLVATATWDGTVQVYRTDRWRPLRTLRGHEQTLRTVAFAPGGSEILTGSLDHTARLWSPFTSRLSDYGLAAQTWLGRETPGILSSVALGRDAGWVAATDRRTIWLKSRGGPLAVLAPAPGVSKGAPPDEGGRLVLTGAPAEATAQAGPPSALAAPEGRDILLAAMRGPEVHAWERGEDGAWHGRVITLDGAAGNLSRRLIAVAADGARYAVEVLAPDVRGFLVCAVDAALCGTAPGAHIAYIGFAADAPAPDACRARASPTALALSDDGRLLAAGGDDCTVRLHDVAAPDDAPRLMDRHVGNITALDISADGSMVAAASADWTGSLWTPATGAVVRLTGSAVQQGHRSAVDAIHFAPSGRHAVTVSADERMIVWDAATGEPFLEYAGFEQSLNALDVKPSAAGVRIATGNNTGDIIVQPFFDDSRALLDHARGTLDAVLGAAPP
ncbi:AAA family ATPase [Roseivivax isoporae]|uniref:Novel STAND NTPase 1 domain-containing protein n=1 Tax=Roseivivax isoporae LMG 25204 TaxID=1449351 RepID=X7F7D7_9RHOB|nr:AAA family ATPase [Roseivivax isoporae]ETX28842.1 hypothetical protein RISW2_04675 [Roseivivax isoporae LMG 25204]